MVISQGEEEREKWVRVWRKIRKFPELIVPETE